MTQAGDRERPATGSARQSQFLTVVDRDEATRRFHEHLRLQPLGTESVPLHESAGRVLAEDIASEVDVTGFDRSNVDGFAIVAASTAGASEIEPICLTLNQETLTPGVVPQQVVRAGTATALATGSVIPRGADAVVMIEDTQVRSAVEIEVTKPAAAGQSISFAGTDIARGECVLRRHQPLTSREIGVLAAIGRVDVPVFRRPTVAVISTGDEIVPPGEPLPGGCVYDSNQAILSAAITECGGIPVPLGVVRDDEQQLREAVSRAREHDVVLLSGGTSKGEGDLCYRVVSELSDPGIVAHGVALKPGKPVCLAVEKHQPIVVLPGFPTSAVFTFQEFVAPVIQAYAGQRERRRSRCAAVLANRVNSERGRTEYLLVHLVSGDEGLLAFPMGKGSGSVTAFSTADGFVAIDQHTEIVESGSQVEVTLLSDALAPADLVVIGSHCRGLDVLLSAMQSRGFTTKAIHVGSLAGVQAAARGACDVAGVHLLDPDSGVYNRAWLSEGTCLVAGYTRLQGFVCRPEDTRFTDINAEQAVAVALADADCFMVNRNRGSGTRVLTDGLLGDNRPAGYAVETRSHNAVCAAVAQSRADWGIAIEPVAKEYGLRFLPLTDEHYDFMVPQSRRSRPAVAAFEALLQDETVREQLQELGLRSPDE